MVVILIVGSINPTRALCVCANVGANVSFDFGNTGVDASLLTCAAARIGGCRGLCNVLSVGVNLLNAVDVDVCRNCCSCCCGNQYANGTYAGNGACPPNGDCKWIQTLDSCISFSFFTEMAFLGKIRKRTLFTLPTCLLSNFFLFDVSYISK